MFQCVTPPDVLRMAENADSYNEERQGNPSLAHSIIFLLVNCLNASIKTDKRSPWCVGEFAW
jgi:hypothetical protein